MEHLPPTGWADAATKTDLDHLCVGIESQREIIEARFDTKVADLRAEMANQFKEAQRWQLTALACVTTILGALITFT